MNYFKVIVITAPGLECYWNTAGAIAHMFLLCNGGKNALLDSLEVIIDAVFFSACLA